MGLMGGGGEEATRDVVVHKLGRGGIFFNFRRGGGLVRMWRILGSTSGMVGFVGVVSF